jgi:aminoglycoside phosphotransferase (APT) family kinase protein
MALAAYTQGTTWNHARLTTFVESRYGAAPESVRLNLRPLNGGLDSAAIAQVNAHYRRGSRREQAATFVVKRLDGDQRREAHVYQALVPSGVAPAPRLLAAEVIEPTTMYLYIERIRPWRIWPWTDTECAANVLERLARLHASSVRASFISTVPEWDYEAELHESARTSLDFFQRAVWHDHLRGLRPFLPHLNRIVEALPAIRHHLLREGSPGSILHGDVHPGNVVLRRQGQAKQVVLLDWARSRVGSPFEDVGSWLQSLGYWEPEARRHHDSLLQRYLAARGLSTGLNRATRDAYWFACASNVLAGALRYHLAVATGWGTPSPNAQGDAVRAARDCLRVIRRADACWRA